MPRRRSSPRSTRSARDAAAHGSSPTSTSVDRQARSTACASRTSGERLPLGAWARPSGERAGDKQRARVAGARTAAAPTTSRPRASTRSGPRGRAAAKRSLFDAQQPGLRRHGATIRTPSDGRADAPTESIEAWMNPDTSRTHRPRRRSPTTSRRADAVDRAKARARRSSRSTSRRPWPRTIRRIRRTRRSSRCAASAATPTTRIDRRRDRAARSAPSSRRSESMPLAYHRARAAPRRRADAQQQGRRAEEGREADAGDAAAAAV